jgi:hypothetical protein
MVVGATMLVVGTGLTGVDDVRVGAVEGMAGVASQAPVTAANKRSAINDRFPIIQERPASGEGFAPAQ